MYFKSWGSSLTRQQFKENVANIKENLTDSTKRWKVCLLGHLLLVHYWGALEEVETRTGGIGYDRSHYLLVGLCFFHSNQTRVVGLVFARYVLKILLCLIPFLISLWWYGSFLPAFFPWFTFYIILVLGDHYTSNNLLSGVKTLLGFDSE